MLYLNEFISISYEQNLFIESENDFLSFQCCYSHLLVLKADMKSYKALETAAIFFYEPFLKQGIR